MNPLLKLLGARSHDVIKDGKLWEVTQLGGLTLSRRAKQPAQPLPLDLHRGGELKAQRVHDIKIEDDAKNMTRDVDFL